MKLNTNKNLVYFIKSMYNSFGLQMLVDPDNNYFGKHYKKDDEEEYKLNSDYSSKEISSVSFYPTSNYGKSNSKKIIKQTKSQTKKQTKSQTKKQTKSQTKEQIKSQTKKQTKKSSRK